MSLPLDFVKTKITKKNSLVSVIIPTYNEEKDIGGCLDSLKKQSYSNIEIIIVDDGSVDKTREIVNMFSEKNKKIILINGEHRGPGFSRNLGVKNSHGEILVFVDADMVLFEDYVEKLIEPVVQNIALGTIESIQYNLRNTKMQECWGKEVRITQIEGVNSSTVRAIAKNDFLQLGGFDPRYGYADDRTFFLKYGARFLILPEVKCYHKTPETFKGVFKQSRWIGASIDNFFVRNKIIKYFAPFFMILLSPVMIPFLALKKSFLNGEMRLFFPWMLIFMVARYFGTIGGISRRIFMNMDYK